MKKTNHHYGTTYTRSFSNRYLGTVDCEIQTSTRTWLDDGHQESRFSGYIGKRRINTFISVSNAKRQITKTMIATGYTPDGDWLATPRGQQTLDLGA